MKELEERIQKDGKILPGDVLKVGSFFNQQMDSALIEHMGAEIARMYENRGVTKILTVEASGIAMAMAVAMRMGVPMVFAKKHSGSNVSGNVYSAPVASYTHGKTYNVTVSAEYLTERDTVLLVDDFLAVGNALRGLLSLCKQAGAEVAGAAVGIEKRYQGGGDALRRDGLRVDAMASITSMDAEKGFTFYVESN